jgi:TolA-binding protein
MKGKLLKVSIAVLAMATASQVMAAEENNGSTATLGQMDNIEEQIVFETKMNQLEQLKLQRRNNQEELASDRFAEILNKKQEELFIKFSEREKALLDEIAALKAKNTELTQALNDAENAVLAGIDNVSNNLFVTAISGSGENLVATIYFNETIGKVSAGAKISDKIKVSRVHSNGITLNDGNKDTFVHLTNEKYAFSKTFNKDAAKLLSSQASGLSLRR